MQVSLMLLEKLHDLTNTVQNNASDVERVEKCFKYLKSRNAKLKLKSEELESFLKLLMAKLDNKNRLKSHLSDIKEDVLTKSNSIVATRKEIKLCHENINNIKVDLTLKQDGVLTLNSDLEMLRKWNSLLKCHMEELHKNISDLSGQDLEKTYLGKIKKIKDLQVKYLCLENNIKKIDKKINTSLRKSHDKEFLSETMSHNNNIPTRLSDVSFNSLIFKTNLSSIFHTVARPFKTMHKTPLIDKLSQPTCNKVVNLTTFVEASEEIFITAPPCQSSFKNKILSCGSEEKITNFLDQDKLNYRDFNNNNNERDLFTYGIDKLSLESAKPEHGQNDQCDDLTKGVVLRMKRCDVSDKNETQIKHQVEIKNSQYLSEEDDDFLKWLKTIDNSPNRLAIPVRRHVSLGDLSNNETFVSLFPKRRSHQMELLTINAYVVNKSNRYKVGDKKGNLMKKRSFKASKFPERRVTFDPIALLFSSAVEGELSIVRDAIYKIGNMDITNEDGLTSLHYAIFAGNVNIVEFLVEEGCNVNAADIDGWTPLHCAASCNDLKICEFLIENGAALFATSYGDLELPSDKCDEMEAGCIEIRNFLLKMEVEMGLASNGVVYALYDYEAEAKDELCFKIGDGLIILRKGDDQENEWWWSCLEDKEGYIPRNLVGKYPRVVRK